MLITEGDVDAVGLRTTDQLISDGICGGAAYVQQTPSTNTLALADLQSGNLAAEQCPKLYLADVQTAGRGRHGRTWISTGGSLAFSLIVDRPNSGGDTNRSSKLVSLAVGVAIARSLEFEFAPLQTKLKWPNDVHIGGGKVAGILLETTQSASNHVVIGVGVNVDQSPCLDDDPASGPIVSLAQVVGHRVHRYELLGSLVHSIVRAIAEVDQFADDLIADFRSRCLLAGKTIQFQDGQRSREGLCRGVSDQGELLVETDSGTERLHSGEARTVRPQSRS